MLKIEKRYVAPRLSVEQRAEGDIAGLRGYAAVFNKRSVELWGFYEVVAPGAFADSLAAEDDVRALWNRPELDSGAVDKRLAAAQGR